MPTTTTEATELMAPELDPAWTTGGVLTWIPMSLSEIIKDLVGEGELAAAQLPIPPEQE